MMLGWDSMGCVGRWNPWSAPYNGGLNVGPGKFKQAYRHIVAVMRGRGASNITWALHYNAQNYPEDPRNVPAEVNRWTRLALSAT